MVAFFFLTDYNTKCASGCGSAWLERRLREAEVASSNPATPIHAKMPNLCFYRDLAFFWTVDQERDAPVSRRERERKEYADER